MSADSLLFLFTQSALHASAGFPLQQLQVLPRSTHSVSRVLPDQTKSQAYEHPSGHAIEPALGSF